MLLCYYYYLVLGAWSGTRLKEKRKTTTAIVGSAFPCLVFLPWEGNRVQISMNGLMHGNHPARTNSISSSIISVLRCNTMQLQSIAILIELVSKLWSRWAAANTKLCGMSVMMPITNHNCRRASNYCWSERKGYITYSAVLDTGLGLIHASSTQDALDGSFSRKSESERERETSQL